MATMYSSVPAPPYDIHPNDFLNQNYYRAPNDGTFSMGTGESFYTPSLNGVQTPTFPYPLPFQHPNHIPYLKPPQVGPVPHFQPQPSFTGVLSPTSGPSTSPQGALSPSPASVRKKVQKANPKSKENAKRTTRNATQFAKRELLTGNPKRKRSPNKRPPGTSFSDLLDGLPHEARKAVEVEYKGCCDSINTKDITTKQKHWFTNRHCLNLPDKYQEAVPNFVCPAFLAFNSRCRSKAGRYDSTERHCQNCAGFQEINSGQNEAFPVVVTRSAYRDVQTIRMALALAETKNKGKGEAAKGAIDSVRRMLAALFKDGLPVINHEEGESNGSGAIVQRTTTQPTVTAPPPATFESEPVFEPEVFGEWDVDTSHVATREGESNASGAIITVDLEHTAQSTTQPPTPTILEPVFEPETWDCTLINYGGKPDVSGAIVTVDRTAQPTGTILEPVFEPETVDFDTLINYGGKPDVSGAIATVDHTAQSILERMFEPETVDEWDFDSLINYEGKPDVAGVVADHTAPRPATSEPVFEPDRTSVERGFDDVIFF